MQVDINLVLGAGSAVAAPVLRDVSQRGLSSISSEIGQLEDTLFSSDGTFLFTEEQLAFGTFSIHNLGSLRRYYHFMTSLTIYLLAAHRYIWRQVRRSYSVDTAGMCAIPGVDSGDGSACR